MLIPVKWLKEYVDIKDIDEKILAQELTLSGSHVDAIHYVDQGVEEVVVGKIVAITPHPDADKLQITQIDIGEEVLQIVTGAPNVLVGQYVPVALVGAKLPGGVKIKKGKLRGEVSCGMLCGAEELGISEQVVPKDNKDGIFILDKAYPLGLDIKEVMGLHGAVIDFEITPNRPDCLSMLGMAREVSATFKKEIHYPEDKVEMAQGDVADYLESVQFSGQVACERYVGRVIRDVKVGPSPLWMQQRLMEAGVRPVNNVVDITNYVMLETGQPLHAFDYDKLSGKKISLRNGKAQENFVTLDGVCRKLDEDILLICDAERPVAIAGIMGGAETEVSESTQTILLESALFDAKSIRLSSKRLGLRTEASGRFEKGLDPNGCSYAANRACRLMETLGVGKVLAGEKDVYPNPLEKQVISLRPQKVKDLLNVDIDKETMISTLHYFEMKTKDKGDHILVEVPTFRQDVKEEADLIEEVGRIYGFHLIPSEPYLARIRQGKKSTFRIHCDEAKQQLIGYGFNEITTYSFISPKSFSKLLLPQESLKRNCITLQNPLGEDFSVMRTTLMGNMMDVLSKNYKRKVEVVRAFELGHVFMPKESGDVALPKELKTLCLGIYGQGEDFFSLKGYLTALFHYFGISRLDFEPEKHHPSFHPGRSASILVDNHVLGNFGEVHPLVCEQYGVKGRFYLAEINFEMIYMLANREKTFSELPKYPGMKRDLALIAPKEIMVKKIEEVIQNEGGPLLVGLSLFDVYEGDQIESDKKSVAYQLDFRGADRTLTDEEVSKVTTQILNTLKDTLGVYLRQ